MMKSKFFICRVWDAKWYWWWWWCVVEDLENSLSQSICNEFNCLAWGSSDWLHLQYKIWSLSWARLLLHWYDINKGQINNFIYELQTSKYQFPSLYGAGKNHLFSFWHLQLELISRESILRAPVILGARGRWRVWNWTVSGGMNHRWRIMNGNENNIKEIL